VDQKLASGPEACQWTRSLKVDQKLDSGPEA